MPGNRWVSILKCPVAKSRRLNVLGFLSPQQPLTSFVFEGTINSEVIIACFNEFGKTLTKPTWVVIDNAPVHTSEAFAKQRVEWEAKGLFIKYLPPYAPELNRLETFGGSSSTAGYPLPPMC